MEKRAIFERNYTDQEFARLISILWNLDDEAVKEEIASTNFKIIRRNSVSSKYLCGYEFPDADKKKSYGIDRSWLEYMFEKYEDKIS